SRRISGNHRDKCSCDPPPRAPQSAVVHGGQRVTPPSDPLPVDCPQPIDAATLMDYWLGALQSTEEEPIEEHLMGCDRCGDRLREVMGLAESLRTLARSGVLQVVISDHVITRADEMGQRIRQYAPPLGGSVQCTVS